MSSDGTAHWGPLESISEIPEAIPANPMLVVLGYVTLELSVGIVAQRSISEMDGTEFAVIMIPARFVGAPSLPNQCAARKPFLLAQ